MSNFQHGSAASGEPAGQDRREFLKTSSCLLALGGVGVLGATAPLVANAATEKKPTSAKPKISRNQVILFQGDSITDAGRSREKASVANDQAGLGSGYAGMAAAALLHDHPSNSLNIYNRGISGNKVFQLAERWDADCLKLNPGLVSILIGVNDFWHTLGGGYKGTVETYERDYQALVERTLKALPGVQLVICEPFVLRSGAVNEKWFPAFDAYRAAARRVADEFHALFVPFQLTFDRAVKHAPAEYWAKDGVHPSSAGAALMAHAWHSYVVHGGPR